METRRSGRFAMDTERPWKSTSVVGNDAAVADGDASGAEDAAGRAPPHEARRRTRTERMIAKRRVMWRTPLTRRCGCRERGAQATRVGAFALHGGATLPELHRLRWTAAYSVVRREVSGRVRWTVPCLGENGMFGGVADH